MKENLTFVTIFPKVENMHITKEIGMIPWGMQEYYGYDAKILLFHKNEYPNLRYTQGLKHIYISSKAKRSVSAFWWMCKHCREIDVLHLFYQCRYTQISILFYLLLNKKGKVYVHFDHDGTTYESYKIDLSKNKIKNYLQRVFYEKVVYTKKNQDRILWGAQNRLAVKEIRGKFPYQNVVYVPDGYLAETDLEKISFDKKDNIILSVGRLGTAQKRTDLLLNAFLEISLKYDDWKMKLIGPIEDSFKPYIDIFFENHPEMRTKIEFTGPIYDRNLLNEEYEKAKIFCLSSDYESFGIVAAEALAKGCSLVLSSYAAAADITDYEKYGELFEIGDQKQLIMKIEKMINNEPKMQWICEQGPEYAKNMFSYKALLKPIDAWLKKD